MIERERSIITAMFLLMVVLWLGFFFHTSPSFAGSLTSGILAIAAAALMIFPAALSAAIKRIPKFKAAVIARVPARKILSWHVYTGVLGSILALLHTGHKFQSPLGIALTAMMLITTLSGYYGLHFLGLVSLDLREKQEVLKQLQTSYNETAAELARHPEPILQTASHGIFARLATSLFVTESTLKAGVVPLPYKALHLSESIADLEYAIESHELLKKRSDLWLKSHLYLACIFYVLLGLHIWSGIHFGLRWFA